MLQALVPDGVECFGRNDRSLKIQPGSESERPGGQPRREAEGRGAKRAPGAQQSVAPRRRGGRAEQGGALIPLCFAAGGMCHSRESEAAKSLEGGFSRRKFVLDLSALTIYEGIDFLSNLWRKSSHENT